jgi:acetolactate synthase small subunit
MACDVTVILDDRPGELARLAEVAGAAGVNLDGAAAFAGEGKGVVHVLVAEESPDPRRVKSLKRAPVRQVARRLDYFDVESAGCQEVFDQRGGAGDAGPGKVDLGRDEAARPET